MQFKPYTKNLLKKYWIFIDDSGNIELSSPDKYFIYAALVFENENEVKKFKEEYDILINTFFQKELKRCREIKGSLRLAWWKRKLIYDLIIKSNCKLVAVVLEKEKSSKLKEIEEEYKILDKAYKGYPLKAKLGIKEIRKNKYGFNKSYLIAEIICIVCKQILLFKKSNHFIIKSDKEELANPGNSSSLIDYMSKNHKFLKWFYNEYDFAMEDSKDNYCLQGADFLANAISKFYNKNEEKYFNYINDQKQIFISKAPHIKEATSISIDNILENDNI